MLLKPILKSIFGKRMVKNQSSFCPVCGEVGCSFSPLPDFYFQNAKRHNFVHFGRGEMTSLDTYSCTNCGASDRERLYALWIDQQITLNRFSKASSVMHFAPERALSTKLRGLKVFDYKTADLLMQDADYQIDIMSMPFEDETYDFFICSHVLEHVENDDRAINELFRITKKNGCGILVSPVVLGLKKTIEDPTVKDDAGRWEHFGQNDHVRLYAHDEYVNKIRNSGFHIEQLGERYFGQKVFRSLGLKPTSILYVVNKGV